MKVILALILLLTSLFTAAQDSLKLYELREVVVTGEVEPQSVRASVYNVRTIPMERLQSRGATRLQDALNTELNIRFAQDPALGGSNLTMMGLPGQNVKVLVDGVPVIGKQGTGNEVNLNQFNVNAVERIEIVEGPMAVIYGADALAGVINIITKKSVEEKFAVSATLQEETAGNEYGLSKGLHNQRVSLASAVNAFYFRGSLSHNAFRGWTGDSTGREKTWHPKAQWMASAVAGYQQNGWHAYYRADYLHEKIYNPAQFAGNEAIDKNYITQRLMHQVQLTTSLSEKVSFNSALSYTGFRNRTQSVAVDRQTGRETLANSALQNTDEFTGMTIRGALQYRISDAVSIQPGYDINLESGSGSRLKEGTNGIQDYAGFLSADLKLGALSLRPGVRVIRNSVYEAPPVIPSLNTKITINDRHDVRVSYGRGFRAPSIRELFFNFFDASHSIEGNPDLEAERSHTVNASWNARLVETDNNLRLNGVISAFYNDVDNMIGYGVRPGSNVTTYVNINEFRSKGLTLNTVLSNGNTDFRAGLGCTGRYNSLTEANGTLPAFTWSPEITTSVTHQVDETFSVSLFYKYTGKTPAYELDPAGEDIVLVETDGYHWADLTAQKSLGKHLELSAGIRNLFNVTQVYNSASGASTHTGSGSSRPVGYGRSFFVTLNVRFTKS